MTSLTYPQNGSGGGVPPQYTYQYDVMGRLNGMKKPLCTSYSGNRCTNYNYGVMNTVATATYGVAGEMTGLTYDSYAEPRTYNSLLQMTRMTVPGVMDMQYNCPATQNNGRITQSQDLGQRGDGELHVRRTEPADEGGDDAVYDGGSLIRSTLCDK